MRRGRIAVASVLAALLVGTAGTGQAADLRSQLRRVNLSLRDLPAGFTLRTARYWTNAQAASDSATSEATYRRHGRLLSYEVEYLRGGIVDALGVDATVIAYRDERGARWAYALALDDHRGERAMSPGQLGSAAAGFTYDETSEGYRVTVDTIVARRGRYVIIVEGVGLRGTVSAQQIAALARTIDARTRR
jgi:hypothetical protein